MIQFNLSPNASQRKLIKLLREVGIEDILREVGGGELEYDECISGYPEREPKAKKAKNKSEQAASVLSEVEAPAAEPILNGKVMGLPGPGRPIQTTTPTPTAAHRITYRGLIIIKAAAFHPPLPGPFVSSPSKNFGPRLGHYLPWCDMEQTSEKSISMRFETADGNQVQVIADKEQMRKMANAMLECVATGPVEIASFESLRVPRSWEHVSIPAPEPEN